MKLPIQKLVLLFLTSASLLPAPRAVATTISMQGSILGLSAPTNDSLSTLDFYFFTALSDQFAQISHAVVGNPIGSGTALDIGIYLPPDNEGLVLHRGTNLSNTNSGVTMQAGQQYIVAFVPRNSDFDGYWPLPAVENCDSAFSFFDYNSTITGDIR